MKAVIVKSKVERGSGRRNVLSALSYLERIVARVGWFGTRSSSRDPYRDEKGKVAKVKRGKSKGKLKGKREVTYDATKALNNEFGNPSSLGSKKRPPRPFIFKDQKNAAVDLRLALQHNRKWAKATIKEAFKALAEGGKHQIQKNIDNVFFPELKPLTIKARKELHKNDSTKPLIDTGSMRKNVKGKVEVE